MDALVIIGVHFVDEDAVSFTDPGNIIPDAGSDEMILDPAVRSFDLAFCLWGKSVNGFNAEIADRLPPLRIAFVCEQVMLVKELIPAPDKAEDGVRIDVKGVRDAVFKDKRL